MLTQQTVLAEHEGRISHLGEAGGEMVVPEQSHFFAERVAALEHAIEPPAAKLLAAFVVSGGDAADVEQRLRDLRGLRLSVNEQVESSLEAEAFGLHKVLATGPEGRAAVKVSGPLAAPGVGGRRLPRLPGLAGVDLIERRECLCVIVAESHRD